MFRNMKLKGTLFTAFGLTIGISIVFIAAALGILFTSGNQYEDMLEREVVAEETVMHARLYTNMIARNMREILMDPTADDIPKLEADIEEIGQAVEKEAEDISRLTDGVDQISSVVHSNSATSEESAATSEELSSQATVMKTMMARFKLKRNELGVTVSSDDDMPAYTNTDGSDYYSDHTSAFSKY